MSSKPDMPSSQADLVSFEEGETDFDDDCQHIFPQRLMSIVSDDRNAESICWLPHGRAFIIRNRKMFAEKVMPKFFPRKSKYSSFTRKLNRWNFVRVSSGPELGAYYHEFFLRDKSHLAAQMFCKNARTKMAMASSDPAPTVALVAAAEASNNNCNTVVSTAAAGMSCCTPQQEIPVVSNHQTTASAVDAATTQMMLMRQQMDPAMCLLLEQQMSISQQQSQNALLGNLVLQQQQQQMQDPMALQLELLNAKNQQERMFQLQQLMNRNLQQQQPTSSGNRRNNFRASAA